MTVEITTRIRKFEGSYADNRLVITPKDILPTAATAYRDLHLLYKERKEIVNEIFEQHNELKEMLTDPDVFKAKYEEDNKPDDWLALTEKAFLDGKQARLSMSKGLLKDRNAKIDMLEETLSPIDSRLTAGRTYEVRSDVECRRPMVLYDSVRQGDINTAGVTDIVIKI